MANIYITSEPKSISNSFYSLGYFLDQQFPAFIQANFPQYDTDALYKATYGLEIQEVLQDELYNQWVTKRFAVVTYDSLNKTEKQLLIGMQDVWAFMGIERLSNAAQARTWLDTNTTMTKINNTTYEVYPEFEDDSLGTIPATLIYL